MGRDVFLCPCVEARDWRVASFDHISVTTWTALIQLAPFNSCHMVNGLLPSTWFVGFGWGGRFYYCTHQSFLHWWQGMVQRSRDALSSPPGIPTSMRLHRGRVFISDGMTKFGKETFAAMPVWALVLFLPGQPGGWNTTTFTQMRLAIRCQTLSTKYPAYGSNNPFRQGVR